MSRIDVTRYAVQGRFVNEPGVVKAAVDLLRDYNTMPMHAFLDRLGDFHAELEHCNIDVDREIADAKKTANNRSI